MALSPLKLYGRSRWWNKKELDLRFLATPQGNIQGGYDRKTLAVQPGKEHT